AGPSGDALDDAFECQPGQASLPLKGSSARVASVLVSAPTGTATATLANCSYALTDTGATASSSTCAAAEPLAPSSPGGAPWYRLHASAGAGAAVIGIGVDPGDPVVFALPMADPDS